jgi:hypothetical protein
VSPDGSLSSSQKLLVSKLVSLFAVVVAKKRNRLWLTCSTNTTLPGQQWFLPPSNSPFHLPSLVRDRKYSGGPFWKALCHQMDHCLPLKNYWNLSLYPFLQLPLLRKETQFLLHGKPYWAAPGWWCNCGDNLYLFLPLLSYWLRLFCMS